MVNLIVPRLCLMMFLNFFIWGAWFTTLGSFMSDSGLQSSLATALVLHWAGAIISPFIVGMVADRFFPTQIVLGVLHILGGLVLMAAPLSIQGSTSPWPFLMVIFVHMICYMPTINLTTSLSFNALTSAQNQFPLIRVFGTIGWIVAGLLISFVFGVDGKDSIFYIAGTAGLILGFYSFTLPDTPPPAAGTKISVRDVLGLEALQLLKDRSYAIFALCSFLICIPLSVYYGYLSKYLDDLQMTKAAATQTVGQMSEIIFMLLMPLFFRRLGVKWMLGVGMFAWVARYAAFAIGVPGMVWPIWVGIALHGICYDFFFVTGYIYTDQRAPRRIRSQAQGFLVWITLGWGMVTGSFLSKFLFNPILEKTTGRIPDWHQNWWIQAGIAGVVCLAFIVLFRDRGGKLSEETYDQSLKADLQP